MHTLNVALAVLAMMTIQFASAAPAPWDKSKLAQTNNAYTGPGGNASGGSVSNTDYSNFLGFFLNLLSNNAGDGGSANAGPAGSGNIFNPRHEREHEPATSDVHSDASSYSGVGGQAYGGSVNSAPALFNIASNNAGNGGQASSGSSQSGGCFEHGGTWIAAADEN
jgi:hypothetical protein